MIDKKYSKCPKCKEDEKYIVHLIRDGKDVRISVCSKQCMLSKKEKE